MNEILKTACLQMTSGPEIEENLKTAELLVSEAAAQGAQLICTPENTDFMRGNPQDKLDTSLTESDHPALSLFAGLAQKHGAWILVGSLSIKVAEDKISNRSYLFNDKGDIVAQYDKIHLFDVDLPTGEIYRESDIVQPGDKAVVGQTPWGTLGMSICYDLRFAPLYRALAQGGASILTIPAAFTVPTGRAHWEVLLRARAIETGSFVIAPAQCGTHEGGRETYGHSLIISPWGEILAQAGDEPGFIMADLDLAAVDKARSAVPALKNERAFGLD